MSEQEEAASGGAAPIPAVDLAALLAARMCHDLISPAGAIVSGLDLLEDPSAQDMRDDAMTLIADSARKLVALIAFDRVAFGASSAAETFDPKALEALAQDIFAHQRATLVWQAPDVGLPKAAGRAALNLAQICGGVLPMGGEARVTVSEAADGVIIVAEAEGGRVRLRPEVADGLEGRPLTDGLSGHWVQAYYLHAVVAAAGGALEVETADGRAVFTVRLPG